MEIASQEKDEQIQGLLDEILNNYKPESSENHSGESSEYLNYQDQDSYEYI